MDRNHCMIVGIDYRNVLCLHNDICILAVDSLGCSDRRLSIFDCVSKYLVRDPRKIVFIVTEWEIFISSTSRKLYLDIMCESREHKQMWVEQHFKVEIWDAITKETTERSEEKKIQENAFLDFFTLTSFTQYMLSIWASGLTTHLQCVCTLFLRPVSKFTFTAKWTETLWILNFTSMMSFGQHIARVRHYER